MAKSYGYYVCQNFKENCPEFEELCFICAVKRAVSVPANLDLRTFLIFFKTTEDDDITTICTDCGEFIKDVIII